MEYQKLILKFIEYISKSLSTCISMINIKLIKHFKGCLKSSSTQYVKTPLSWYIKYFSQLWKWGVSLNKFVCDVKVFYKQNKNSIREEPAT